MGDRCYFAVQCLAKDKAAFEELGFHDASNNPGLTLPAGGAWMVDTEANYAHSGELPTNIPWTGRSEVGGSYGASEYACDGQKLAEVETGFDSSGYVIGWKDGAPDPDHVRQVNEFLAINERAEKLLQTPPSS